MVKKSIFDHYLWIWIFVNRYINIFATDNTLVDQPQIGRTMGKLVVSAQAFMKSMEQQAFKSVEPKSINEDFEDTEDEGEDTKKAIINLSSLSKGS